MVNKIKTNSTVGLYILQDQGGWVAANTPGEADLDLLSDGDTYWYGPLVLQFRHMLTFNDEGDSRKGHSTYFATGSGLLGHSTGEADRGMLTVACEVTTANGSKIKKFAKLNNRIGDGQKYLVHQYASETFEEFPNASGTLKKYLPVIVRGVDVIEQDGRNNTKLATIGLEELWTS